MALGIYFAHDGFTPEKYATAIKKLEDAGAGAPKGRTLHVALETDGQIQVFDIWESQEEFDAFGPTLMPMLAGLVGGLAAAASLAMTDAQVEQLSKMPPLERLGQPEDITGVVSFLAGPDGGWVNGQVLRANGGFA